MQFSPLDSRTKQKTSFSLPKKGHTNRGCRHHPVRWKLLIHFQHRCFARRPNQPTIASWRICANPPSNRPNWHLQIWDLQGRQLSCEYFDRDLSRWYHLPVRYLFSNKNFYDNKNLKGNLLSGIIIEGCHTNDARRRDIPRSRRHTEISGIRCCQRRDMVQIYQWNPGIRGKERWCTTRSWLW